MIDLSDGTAKIVDNCLLLDDESKLDQGSSQKVIANKRLTVSKRALDRTELQHVVEDIKSTNSNSVADLEGNSFEEFEWEEDFNPDGNVERVDAGDRGVDSVEKNGEEEGVRSNARNGDNEEEDAVVGDPFVDSVEKNGEEEGVRTNARNGDEEEDAVVGDPFVDSVEKNGEEEGVRTNARNGDNEEEDAVVGDPFVDSVEKNGEEEGVRSNTRNGDNEEEDAVDNSDIGSVKNASIIPSLVIRVSFLNDFYLKPATWYGRLETVQEDFIRLPNRTNNFCCINALLQVFFRINLLRNFLLEISHLPYGVPDRESFGFIEKIANMYAAVKCVGKNPDYYIEAVNTCYASTFYSMPIFQIPISSTRTRSGTNVQKIAASVYRCNHQDSNEILLMLIKMLDNVYRYQNVIFDVDSSLGYQIVSAEQSVIDSNLPLKDNVLNYYLRERISSGIRPCSELFAILLLHKDCCLNCGKISLYCTTVGELVIDLPHYDPSSKIFKCEFNDALRNNSFFIPEIISKNCYSCSPSNSIQHERTVRIMRAPAILVRIYCVKILVMHNFSSAL